jgi:hypothetical protein
MVSARLADLLQDSLQDEVKQLADFCDCAMSETKERSVVEKCEISI